MNFLKRVYDEIGHKGTTTSTELRRAAKKLLGKQFAGVFARDKVPSTLNGYPLWGRCQGQYAIVNLDASHGSGTHWFAIAPNGDSYDSLLPNGLVFDIEQSANEDNCGQRALAWCMLHATNQKIAKDL